MIPTATDGFILLSGVVRNRKTMASSRPTERTRVRTMSIDAKNHEAPDTFCGMCRPLFTLGYAYMPTNAPTYVRLWTYHAVWSPLTCLSPLTHFIHLSRPSVSYILPSRPSAQLAHVPCDPAKLPHACTQVCGAVGPVRLSVNLPRDPYTLPLHGPSHLRSGAPSCVGRLQRAVPPQTPAGAQVAARRVSCRVHSYHGGVLLAQGAFMRLYLSMMSYISIPF